MNQEAFSIEVKQPFHAKLQLEMKVGRYFVKTISRSEELIQAFALRYQVFQVEMIGSGLSYGLDSDSFDASADHLAIFDEKTGEMIATCRLNSSLFTGRFYSEQEFDCEPLLKRAERKLEIGRVCVRKEYRKGAIILILWRAIAEYMIQTETEMLFGCGSVMTQDPREALLVYRYLLENKRLREVDGVSPAKGYLFSEFETLLKNDMRNPLSPVENLMAESLLPPLCKSYFDIGCHAVGSPAIDVDFKCIDFLTVLEKDNLDAAVRRKMFGS